MKIEKEFTNPLLKRKEVVASLVCDGATITRAQAKEQLAKKIKAKEELIIVREIKSHFGKRDVEVYAYIYDSKEALEAITPKHLVARNTPAQAESEEAQA